MVRYDIKLDGFKELDNALARLPDRIAGKTLQRSVAQAMRLARKDIKASAPIGESRSPASLEYGRLSQNIKVGRAKTKDKASKAAYVSTGDAFWGYFLERGTRYIAAKPWFAPAFEMASQAVLRFLKEKLKENIDKEFKKLAK